MTKFSTGFRQKRDKRDKEFPLSSLLRASDKVPVSKVWKPGPVTDQGSESSCTGHYAFKLLTSEPIVRTSIPRYITPSYIYTEAQKIDEWTGTNYDGTSVRAVLNVMKREGFIKAFYWADDIAEAVEYLLTRGPLGLGIRWTSSMMNPDSQGAIAPRGRGGSGHAVLAYAANWREKFVTIRNSWGTSWGKRGDCKLSFAHLDMLLLEGGVAAAVEEA